MKPDFSFEKKYWKKGYRIIIGVDEVGRGSLAGPVVAAAAALRIQNFPQFIKITHVHKCDEFEKKKLNELIKYVLTLGINDSKKLSPKKREKLIPEIKKYFYFGIGSSSVSEINRLGIVKATERAMRRALRLVALAQGKQFKGKTFVLVDAFHVKYIAGVGLKHQKAIIHGDGRCVSIAAASILAKVFRDNLMRKLSLKYRKYHWEENKGYGTKKHRIAIKKYGITRHHRLDFVDHLTK